MNKKLEKVVITGATGFIGSNLAQKLLLEGAKVYGVGRNEEKLNAMKQYGDFVPIAASFEQYCKLHELIDDRDFDMFWHFAWEGIRPTALIHSDYSVQIRNIQVTCDAAMSAVKLRSNNSSTLGSSAQFYTIGIKSGEVAFNPSLYGAAKKCALDLFKCIAYENNMNCINIITSNTFGVGDSLNAATVFFIKQLLTNEPVNLVSGDYPKDLTHIDDVVNGIICAAKSDKKYADYYIGHRKITTFKEKLTTMKSILSSESELMFGTYPEMQHVDYSQLDLDALYRDTGFEAKDNFAKNILKTAEWIKSLN